MTTTAASARAELADLEQAIVDGVEVSPKRLAEAREAITIADLAAQGEISRAKIAQEAAAAAGRVEAKAQAALTLDGQPEALYEAYDAAIAALEALVTATNTHGAAVHAAARILGAADVPCVSDWTSRVPSDLDPDNYAGMAQGLRANSVTARGVTHIPTEAGLLVQLAVLDVARRHNGLPLRDGAKTDYALGSPYAPHVLKSRPYDH